MSVFILSSTNTVVISSQDEVPFQTNVQVFPSRELAQAEMKRQFDAALAEVLGEGDDPNNYGELAENSAWVGNQEYPSEDWTEWTIHHRVLL